MKMNRYSTKIIEQLMISNQDLWTIKDFYTTSIIFNQICQTYIIFKQNLWNEQIFNKNPETINDFQSRPMNNHRFLDKMYYCQSNSINSTLLYKYYTSYSCLSYIYIYIYIHIASFFILSRLLYFLSRPVRHRILTV